MSSLREIIAMDMFASIPSGGGKLINGFLQDIIRLIDVCILDVRLRKWPLMSSIWPTVGIIICYVLFIIYGQQWMKKRQAFELRNFMFIYNFFQVVLCSYITYEVNKNPLKIFIRNRFLSLGFVCMDFTRI